MFDFSQFMPDSKGANFYTVDPDLAFLLRRCLGAEDFERARLDPCSHGRRPIKVAE